MSRKGALYRKLCTPIVRERVPNRCPSKQGKYFELRTPIEHFAGLRKLAPAQEQIHGAFPDIAELLRAKGHQLDTFHDTHEATAAEGKLLDTFPESGHCS